MKMLKRIVVFLLLFISAFCGLAQFRSDHLLPLGISLAAVTPLAFFGPRRSRFALLIPVLALVALLIDAFAFHHRIAVKARTWGPVFSADGIVEILESPSGKTTAYVVTDSFPDRSYFAHLSTNRLFPLYGTIEAGEGNSDFQGGVMAEWRGHFLVTGSSLATSAWDERTGKAVNYYEWSLGRESATHSREAFSDYLLSLAPKE